MSAASAVPPEILSEIFLHCPIAVSILHVGSETAWIVGHVCRSWRQTALNTSNLWTEITVPSYSDRFTRPHPQSRPNMKIYLSVLREVLERTAGQPIRLHISFNEKSFLKAVFDVLLDHSEKWTSIHLPMFPQAIPTFDPRRLSLISLQEVNVRNNGIVQASICSSRLQSATFSYEITEENISMVPWHNLTYLQLDGLFMLDRAQVVSRCPRLQTLVLYGSGNPTDSGVSCAGNVVLKHLRRLSVQADRGDYCCLTLPALESLELSKASARFCPNMSQIYDLVDRSSCSLKSISIKDICLVDASIGRLLRLCPDVSHLDLEGNLSSHIFNLIAHDEILPKLTHLGVESCSPHPPVSAILRAMQKRTGTDTACAMLLSARVVFDWTSVTATFIEEIRSMRISASIECADKNEEPPDRCTLNCWHMSLEYFWIYSSKVDHVLRNLNENMSVLDECMRFMESSDGMLTAAKYKHCSQRLKRAMKAIAGDDRHLPQAIEYRMKERAQRLLEQADEADLI